MTHTATLRLPDGAPITCLTPASLEEGLSDGREGRCTACLEQVNRAERSFLALDRGWFLHKECWRDLNDSQT